MLQQLKVLMQCPLIDIQGWTRKWIREGMIMRTYSPAKEKALALEVALIIGALLVAAWAANQMSEQVPYRVAVAKFADR